MVRKYRITMEGTASGGQTWSTTHELTCEFYEVFHEGMRESFAMLTEGKAVYGRPGEGCSGPYTVSKVLIEQVMNS